MILNFVDSMLSFLAASESWHPSERALALLLSQFEDALLETQTAWYIIYRVWCTEYFIGNPTYSATICFD